MLTAIVFCLVCTVATYFYVVINVESADSGHGGGEGSLLVGFVAMGIALLAGLAASVILLIFGWAGYIVNVGIIYFVWKRRNHLMELCFGKNNNEMEEEE